MKIFHQQDPKQDPSDRKEVFITITNPKNIEAENPKTHQFKMRLKLANNIIFEEVTLGDAMNFETCLRKEDSSEKIAISIIYDQFNHLRILFNKIGDFSDIDNKFKEGNTVEVTIRGNGYEQSTKAEVIPPISIF